MQLLQEQKAILERKLLNDQEQRIISEIERDAQEILGNFDKSNEKQVQNKKIQKEGPISVRQHNLIKDDKLTEEELIMEQ